MENYFGIDFGTTNSAVSVVLEVEKDVINIQNIGESLRQPMPSFVAIHRDTGAVKTGLSAKKTILSDENYIVFSSIKSIIGEDKRWNIAGKEWTQIDIAAELFKALKNNVSSKTDMIMEKAVVAVPIGFQAQKKTNLRKAAKQAGIDIVMFVSEPTAAFCSRLNDLHRYSNIAVFDWGGGTLDVVVLQVNGTQVKELASVGLNLAGNDIDKKLAEKITLNVARKKEKDFRFEDLSHEFKLRLLTLCEEAKCNLADEDITSVSIARFDTYGRALEKIDYDYFSLLIEDEVEQAYQCLEQALKEAGMNNSSIDCVLCVGGSCRLRPFQEKLLRHFDREKIIFPRQAMWDIARGASQIAYRPGCYTLNRPIGLVLSNGKFYPLLNIGQRIPTKEKEVLLGVVDSNSNGNHEARFVMTDSVTDASFTEYFPVKLRGFADEIIKIKCYIDMDLIFKMQVSSNRMPDNYWRTWTYDQLKICYDIEGDHNDIK